MLKRILLVVLLTVASAVIATAQNAAMKNYYNQEHKVGLRRETPQERTTA